MGASGPRRGGLRPPVGQWPGHLETSANAMRSIRVKSFRTDLSPFGIYDLAGNAREWCRRPLLADGLRRRAQSVERPVAKLERPADQPSGKCPRRQRQRPELGRLVPRRHGRRPAATPTSASAACCVCPKKRTKRSTERDFSGFSAAKKGVPSPQKNREHHRKRSGREEGSGKGAEGCGKGPG